MKIENNSAINPEILDILEQERTPKSLVCMRSCKCIYEDKCKPEEISLYIQVLVSNKYDSETNFLERYIETITQTNKL